MYANECMFNKVMHGLHIQACNFIKRVIHKMFAINVINQYGDINELFVNGLNQHNLFIVQK